MSNLILAKGRESVRTSTDSRGAMNGIGERITVAMITRNEEGAVAKVVRDIMKALPDAEILIVDSSTDRTPEIARRLGARVIRQFPPEGYGPAMDKALRSGSREVVVTLDCDDTYPVEYIEPMARMVVEQQWDLVNGSRLDGKPEAMPALNYVANWSFDLLASAFFFRRVRDLHSGMRAYRKGLVEGLNYRAKGAALPVELLLRPIRDGWSVTTITIPYRPRIGDSKMQPLEGAWWTLKRIWLSRFA
jgi:glycosyltransferase involved in cell wall biosynthesis